MRDAHNSRKYEYPGPADDADRRQDVRQEGAGVGGDVHARAPVATGQTTEPVGKPPGRAPLRRSLF